MTSTLRFTFTTDNGRTRHVAIHTNDRIDTLHSYLAMYGHPTALEVITDNDRDTTTRFNDPTAHVTLDPDRPQGALTQITIGGKPFRCGCDCNVFRYITMHGLPRYVCNACNVHYGSDRVQPTGLLHSRSCGYQAHPHGPDCGVDCPTCSGRPLPAPQETLASPT